MSEWIVPALIAGYMWCIAFTLTMWYALEKWGIAESPEDDASMLVLLWPLVWFILVPAYLIRKLIEGEPETPTISEIRRREGNDTDE